MVVYGERGSIDDLIKHQRIIWGPHRVWHGASRKLNPTLLVGATRRELDIECYCSKTEFLLIGLKKQLDKMHNSSLNTYPVCLQSWLHLWRTSYLLRPNFSHQPSSKLAITILDSFIVSVLTLIPPQLTPLPPPSFTPNLITVILSTKTYWSLRLSASNRFKTLLPVLLLKLLLCLTVWVLTESCSLDCKCRQTYSSRLVSNCVRKWISK